MTLKERLKDIARYGLVGSVGLGLGGMLLYVLQVRGGPPLQPWHTAVLTEEFRAPMAGDVRTLQDYLRLEDRLFRQLDALVYADAPTGSANRLARYSPGSLPDFRGRTPDWNRTYELPGEGPAILMLHGMSDSPYSLHAMALDLNARGYHVLGMRLPGHGTSPSGLRRARWEDMAAATRIGMRHLTSELEGRPIHIVGYSTGAALALEYTLEALDGNGAAVPASLILVSPAVAVTPLAALARWNRRLARLPGLDKLSWQTVRPEFDPYKYGSFTFNAADQVYRLTRSVTESLSRRAGGGAATDLPPILSFLSTVDATVTADAVVDNLLSRLAPGRNELVLFDVNRNSVGSTVLMEDPGPLTTRLMADSSLSFGLTLVTNASPESNRVVARRKASESADVSVDSLGAEWPAGVISLSHVALPFPPDDPLYGEVAPEDGSLYLGRIMVQGERGLLLFPADWLLRLRHNPFYDYLGARTAAWLESLTPSVSGPGPGANSPLPPG